MVNIDRYITIIMHACSWSEVCESLSSTTHYLISAGEKGFEGDQGEMGPVGPKGEKGEFGGEKGDKGDQGNKGTSMKL